MNEPLYINRFITGLVTQRNPLFTPISTSGLNTVQRHDALIDGLNVEISSDHTLIRRPGFTQFSTAFTSEVPRAFKSVILNGTLYNLFDADNTIGIGHVWKITAGSISTIQTKTAGFDITQFLQVGNNLYMANGVDNKKWNGTTLRNWGIVAPTGAPTLSSAAATRDSTKFWRAGFNFATSAMFIMDILGNIEKPSTIGSPSGTDYPFWTPPVTKDGNGTWFSVGPMGVWQATTAYPNPTINPRTAVVDNNGNLQINTGASGTSGAAEPAWNTAYLGNTADGTLNWSNLGTANILAQYGWSYVYVYHTNTGHISTASPSTFSGPVLGTAAAMAITVGGTGSADPSCSLVDIYRTTDGGSVYLFLDSVANPGAIPWTYVDSLPDSALNPFLIAPIINGNDPPPTGMKMLAYNMGRVWGVVDNVLHYSAGPDCINGIPEEAWPPSNTFTFPSTIYAIGRSSLGILVFTRDQLWIILGGPQTLTFYPQLLLDNFGVIDFRSVSQDGDQFFVYTTQKQLWMLSLSNKDDIGNLNADLLSASLGTTPYVVRFRNGSDSAVFVSNGTTDLWRYDMNLGAWNTVYRPTGGIGAIGTVESTPGVYAFIMAPSGVDNHLLFRDATVNQDDGVSYPAFFTVGSLVVSPPLAPPEQIESIVVQYQNEGTIPTVSVLPNEISGTFFSLPNTADDPWQNPPSTTVLMKRFDWKGVATPLPQLVKHLQVKVTFATEDARNEVLGLAIGVPRDNASDHPTV